MATEKQIQANRLNAQKSTGPRTAEGKAKIRYNAVSHGLRSRFLLLPIEKPEEYQQFCHELCDEWQPQTSTEAILVEQMAVCQWKLSRMENGERDVISKDSFQLQTLGDEQLIMLNRISQYQGRIERSYFRALNTLRQLQKERATTRAAEPAPQPEQDFTEPAPIQPPAPDPDYPIVPQAPEPHKE